MAFRLLKSLNRAIWIGALANIKAVETVMKAIDLASAATNPNARSDLLVYYRILAKNIKILVESYGENDYASLALKAFGDAEFADKKSASEWAAMKGNLLRMGKRQAEAIAVYRKALDDDPDNLDALYGISLILLESNEREGREQAASYMNDFLRKAPATDDRVASIRDLLNSIKRRTRSLP